MRRPRRMDEATAVGIRQPDLDLIALDGGERVEQVIHVETDLDFLALVRNLDLILGFLLLGIVGLEREEVGARGEANAPVLLVGEDRGALQRLPQALAVGFHLAGRTCRYNAAIL